MSLTEISVVHRHQDFRAHPALHASSQKHLGIQYHCPSIDHVNDSSNIDALLQESPRHVYLLDVPLMQTEIDPPHKATTISFFESAFHLLICPILHKIDLDQRLEPTTP